MEKNMTEKEFLAAIQAEDTVPYGLANDYMFHAVLQSSEEALKGLLSALSASGSRNFILYSFEPYHVGRCN